MNFRLLKNVLFLFSPLLFLSGCNKDICDECLTKTGDDVQSIRTASSFNQIDLEGKIELVLTQDTIERIAVVAGKNLIDKIETSISSGLLTIRNHNTCNFVRSFDRKITVYVSVHHLQSLLYNGAGDVNCVNALTDSLISVNSIDGSGTVNLKLNAQTANATLTSGPADIYFTGTAPLLYVYSGGNGTIHTENLVCSQIYLTNNGTGDLSVNTSGTIQAILTGSGNVLCYGHPSNVQKSESGSGRFILR
jgi:hypothetical protein